MKKTQYLLLSALLLSGCATARHNAALVVAASDVAADTLADGWSTASHLKVEECRAKDLPTPEERAECLGKFHPDETQKVITAVETLVAAQLLVKTAAECEALDTCVTETDWKGLYDQVKAAWDAIKPYILAMKKEKSK